MIVTSTLRPTLALSLAGVILAGCVGGFDQNANTAAALAKIEADVDAANADAGTEVPAETAAPTPQQVVVPPVVQPGGDYYKTMRCTPVVGWLAAAVEATNPGEGTDCD